MLGSNCAINACAVAQWREHRILIERNRLSILCCIFEYWQGSSSLYCSSSFGDM